MIFILVSVSSQQSAASDAGEDYVSVSQDLTFGPDSSQQCVLILLTQDSVCEGSMTETFGVRLSSTETSSNTAVQDSASVVIYDASECSKYVISRIRTCYNMVVARSVTAITSIYSMVLCHVCVYTLLPADH